VLCGALVLRSEVQASPLPPVRPSLLQEELLCSGLRAHLLRSGTDLLCSGTLVLRSQVLRSQVLPSPLPPVPPSRLLQEELLRAELLCSGLRAELRRPG
jgi:hypothetical protein